MNPSCPVGDSGTRRRPGEASQMNPDAVHTDGTGVSAVYGREADFFGTGCTTTSVAAPFR